MTATTQPTQRQLIRRYGVTLYRQWTHPERGWKAWEGRWSFRSVVEAKRHAVELQHRHAAPHDRAAFKIADVLENEVCRFTVTAQGRIKIERD